jgi:S-formylglutathione hydrolase FrmB
MVQRSRWKRSVGIATPLKQQRQGSARITRMFLSLVSYRRNPCKSAAVSLAFLLALFCSSAHGQGRIDCNALNSRILGQAVRYCVLLPPGYDAALASHSSERYPVLYFLHGLGDNEQTLFKSGGWNLVEDLRQQHKIGDFLIVTPEARGSFYINSADGNVRYSDFFLHEFIPYIESKYRVLRERSGRAISGISMGGYGALHFAFANPELFSSVSAQSAALMTESPQELSAAVRSGTPLGQLLGSVFGNPFNTQHWTQNDPVVLAKQNKRAIGKLAIYFNCGRDDEFNFEVGAQALDKQLEAEGIKHEFHLYPGNHGASYFLSHLGETMEFHWKAFESGK